MADDVLLWERPQGAAVPVPIIKDKQGIPPLTRTECPAFEFPPFGRKKNRDPGDHTIFGRNALRFGQESGSPQLLLQGFQGVLRHAMGGEPGFRGGLEVCPLQGGVLLQSGDCAEHFKNVL